ncbi:putative ATP-dependent RNA helicase DEAD-box, P-loop containing nucleoside triphosphate hydrolase [Helianthus annuus]|nr:putative ATP-dependent RNA helicase DEAD-box, P-loop containing nucleoside triphosphate hydrolase [Helianthus annuus]
MFVLDEADEMLSMGFKDQVCMVKLHFTSQCLTSGFSCSRSMISSSCCHQRFMLACSPQQTG